MGNEMNESDNSILHTIREEFNEYDLDDGNILRSKQVFMVFHPSNQIKQDPEGRKIADFMVSFNHVASIVPTGKIDTTLLTRYAGQPINESAYLKKVEFKERRTNLNIYETKDFLLFVNNILRDVWLTKYKDDNNIPLYHTIADARLKIKPKKEFL